MRADLLPASAAGGVFSREKAASWRRFAAWRVREFAAGMSSHANTEGGGSFACFGTLIGWLGTASTGSDTSANVLFGSLQSMTARQTGVSPILMASANSAGGVMGKMIAAPSVAGASTAAQTYGQESSILRFVVLHGLALAALAEICASLLAYVPLFAHLAAR